jgi:hypothetical protein
MQSKYASPPPFLNKVPGSSSGTVLKTLISDKVYSLFNFGPLLFTCKHQLLSVCAPQGPFTVRLCIQFSKLSLHNWSTWPSTGSNPECNSSLIFSTAEPLLNTT